MKKTFFFFAMLASVAASATVTVTPISTDYAEKQVTFKVAWTNTPSAPNNNRVWIWIDFCPVTGTQPAATFSPATITSPVKTGGNGTISGLNGRGFFIAHAATNAGTTITATLSNAPVGKFNWCAYGSDAPPNVTYNNVTYNGGTYTFKGTPPFKLVSVDGSQTQEFNKNSITVSEIGFVPKNFTDATGCLGVGFCPYTGSDEVIDASHFCNLRTSGAKNWEAYIQDSRDNNIYRIVQMPDNKWYTAQNLNYRSVTYYCYGNNAANCNESNGVWYKPAQVTATLCPNGWHVPSVAEWENFLSYGGTPVANYIAAAFGGADLYGFRVVACGYGWHGGNTWVDISVHADAMWTMPTENLMLWIQRTGTAKVNQVTAYPARLPNIVLSIRCMKD
jgi:uncharacterized protein (TIGR02145 family)